MLQAALDQVAAGAGLLLSFKQVEAHEDEVLAGDPHRRLARQIAKAERALAAAFERAMAGADVSEEAAEHSAAQGSPTRTPEEQMAAPMERFAAEFEAEAWRMGEPVVDEAAEAAERAALRKLTLFDSEPSKTALRLAYAQRSKDLIVQLTKEQRKAVYALLQKAAIQQMPARELAKALRSLVGLTSQDALRLEKLAAALVKKGYKPDRLAKATARFRGQLVRARAARIARTEMAWAHNTAQLETMKSAVSKLQLEILKEWFTAGDEVTCPICAGMKGQRQPLTAPFTNGKMVPPAHPHCRCAVIYVTGKPKPSATPRIPTVMPMPRPAPQPKPEQPVQHPVPVSQGGFWYVPPQGRHAVLDPAAQARLDAAQTFAGVKQWCKDYLNLDLATDYANASTIPIEGLREIARGAGRAMAAVKYQLHAPSMTIKKAAAGRWWGRRFVNSGRVEVSGGHLKKLSQLKEQLKYCVDNGFHPKNDGDIADITIHEFGHALDGYRRMVTGPFQGVPKEIRDRIEMAVRSPRILVEKSISKYAGKNIDETFAEAFQAWVKNPDPRSWDGPMRDFWQAMNEAQEFF